MLQYMLDMLHVVLRVIRDVSEIEQSNIKLERSAVQEHTPSLSQVLALYNKISSSKDLQLRSTRLPCYRWSIPERIECLHQFRVRGRRAEWLSSCTYGDDRRRGGRSTSTSTCIADSMVNLQGVPSSRRIADV
jgi:hypothetical protein